MDHPGDRSLHGAPIPRSGGIALMAGVTAAVLLMGTQALPWLPYALLLAGTSFIDDMRGLSAGIRLAVHAGVACAFAMGTFAGHGAMTYMAAVLAIVWMTNLYNFMDGSDGLAGGMAVIGFGLYGFAAWIQGCPLFAAMCLAISASAGAFLVYNFHPARIFLGDSGSIPLGFAAAALGGMGWMQGMWPLTFPFLVFSPFIADASTTLVRRLLAGEKIWRPHKDHYYQRLVRMGWGHGKTAGAEYVLMTASGLSALVALTPGYSLLVPLAWICIYAVLMSRIDSAWRRFREKTVKGEEILRTFRPPARTEEIMHDPAAHKGKDRSAR